MQPHRTDMVVEVLAVTSGVGGGGRAPAAGAGTTAFVEQFFFGCGRPCDLAGRVPAVQDVRLD